MILGVEFTSIQTCPKLLFNFLNICKNNKKLIQLAKEH